MRRLAQALVGFAFAFTSVLAVAPVAHAATTAYPTKHFHIEYGNTYTTGTVTFYNRSVTVSGEQKAVSSSGCRFTSAFVARPDFMNGRGESAAICSGSTKFSFSFPADAAGGAESVTVNLFYEEPGNGENNYRLASDYINRS